MNRTKVAAMITGLNVLIGEARKLHEKCMDEQDYAGAANVQKSISEMYDAKMKYEKECENITVSAMGIDKWINEVQAQNKGE